MRKTYFIAVAFTATTIFTACKTRKVERIDPTQQTDLSGRWNDTDSRLVSNEMISDCMSRPWRTDFTAAKGKKPVIIVGTIRNKTTEHIETETFIKDIERSFINSGLVTVVQAGEARKELRDERNDQQTFSSEETKKKWGREKGADFMLNGVMTSIVDQYGKNKVVFYQINLELTNLETNEKVWIGDKKIKKAIQN
jgi:penicillin-binding protein activator